MVKPLSDQLADMSVRAKTAEDAFDAAQKETHDKIEARRQEARERATAAVDKVGAQIKTAQGNIGRDLGAARAKIDADMAALKANVAEHRHEHDVRRAEKQADDLEWEASFAIDYAVASIEQARLSVLDAMDARLYAQDLKQSAP